MRGEQKLTSDFGGYVNVLIKLLNQCQKAPQEFMGIFFMEREGGARLDFIQNMEYKFLELLSVDFVAAGEETIRQNITFRYNTLKARVLYTKSKLRDISALVKLKNPSLLLQLEKASQSYGREISTSNKSTYGRESVMSTKSKKL